VRIWEVIREWMGMLSGYKALCKALGERNMELEHKLEEERKRLGTTQENLNLCYRNRNSLKEQVERLEGQNAELLGEKQNTFAKLCAILEQPALGPIDIPKRLQEVAGLVNSLRAKVAEVEKQLAQEQSRVGELRFQLDEATRIAEQMKAEVQEWASLAGIKWQELSKTS
jgi:chromosome segregation ATPase